MFYYEIFSATKIIYLMIENMKLKVVKKKKIFFFFLLTLSIIPLPFHYFITIFDKSKQ